MSESDVAPEIFTADYVGTPGRRTFFLQARFEGRVCSYLLEKEQVVLLAEKLRELLLLVDSTDTIGATMPGRDPALAIETPVEPEWRIGTIGLTFDEEHDRVVLFIRPVEGNDDEPEQELPEARFLMRRDQVRSFVLHALAVAEEGRPLCQLCGLPMDPSGHSCPASNGHRVPTS